ncbi:hypothetical protein [Erythrobacter ani]|uniref:DUF4145 domain-containing protein n=1 Tax=Erythrobacter ani TaxID=2827235 RepID=A0ABS6SPC5_9SPHN|nr:hypothetical protein [Erythrobacter ani]MBV7266884.1 hypothetical protein [Erythrobacter ani]
MTYETFEVPLLERELAKLGSATVYEANAKTSLTLAWKRLTGADHENWLKYERKQFGQIVSDLETEVVNYEKLKVAFQRIVDTHEDARDLRNMVVHAVWGFGAENEARLYCYRRQKAATSNDIDLAAEACAKLAGECREFAYQVALLASEGAIATEPGTGKIKVKVPTGLVTF